MTGVLVNFATVVVGGLIGSFIRKGVPDRLRAAITNGIALCVLVIGVSGAIETQNQLLMIICIVVGTLIGEALNIERGIEKLGGGGHLTVAGAQLKGASMTDAIKELKSSINEYFNENPIDK